jgi:hypothetical protein
VLGFFASAAMGAVYQIGPVALGTTLVNRRHGWWHFWLHATGVPGMVYAFNEWDMKLLGHFGSFVGLGILLFAITTWKTVARSGQRGPVAWSLALAAAWLLVAALAGLTLAANRFWHFIPLDPLALLRAHAHAGLIGFFVTLLQGVSFQLVPMFTLGKVDDWRPVKGGLWLSQIGLFTLTVGLVFGAAYVSFAGGAAILGGVLVSANALRRSLATRKKLRFDPGVIAFLVGCVVLLCSGALGLLLVWPESPWSSMPGGFSAMLYAVLLLGGGFLPVISGMMCKIVPFLTWMRVYGPKVGRFSTPSAGALAKPRLQRAAFLLQGVALIPLLGGVWTGETIPLRAGAWLLGAGIALFIADMIGVLRHLWRPELRPRGTKPLAP